MSFLNYFTMFDNYFMFNNKNKITLKLLKLRALSVNQISANKLFLFKQSPCVNFFSLSIFVYSTEKENLQENVFSRTYAEYISAESRQKENIHECENDKIRKALKFHLTIYNFLNRKTFF